MKKISPLIGLAIGFSFGILFAPKSGKQFRKDIVRAKTGKQKVILFLKAYKNAGKEAFLELKKSKIAAHAKKHITHAKKHVKKHISHAKTHVKNHIKQIQAKKQKALNHMKKSYKSVIGKLQRKGKNVFRVKRIA